MSRIASRLAQSVRQAKNDPPDPRTGRKATTPAGEPADAAGSVVTRQAPTREAPSPAPMPARRVWPD